MRCFLWRFLLFGICCVLPIVHGQFQDSDSEEQEDRWYRDSFVRKYASKRQSFGLGSVNAGKQPQGYDKLYTYLSACLDKNDQVFLVNGTECQNHIALGRFKNAINATGWSNLEITTYPGYDADLQAYAAGVLEGILTQKVIAYHIVNTVDDYCTGFTEYCKRLYNFINSNMLYIKLKIERSPLDDLYWQSVKRTMLQLSGMWYSYSHRTSGFPEVIQPKITYEINPLLLINMNGDLYDLEKKYNKTKDPLNSEEGSKCSGLVKVTKDNADLLISQVTMSGYQSMTRVLKLYSFAYDKHLYPGQVTSFASYPGLLYSSDDFALLGSGLAVIETTIAVWDNSKYNQTSVRGQLPCWIRVIAANQIARTGREWCEVFRRYNSGTYNNQWIVVDYKRFQPYQPLLTYGLLYVLEQMPGLVIYKDLTKLLAEKSYFPSYNIPFFGKINRYSGFSNKAKEHYWFNYDKCPRSRIFARDHHSVHDLTSLQQLMRYNNYKNDPFSRCNCTPPYTAEAAISARGDLNPPNGTYPLPSMGHVNHGALDYKGTNNQLFKVLNFRALSSPAYDNVPAFSWATSDLAATVRHIGQPPLWNFTVTQTSWEEPTARAFYLTDLP